MGRLGSASVVSKRYWYHFGMAMTLRLPEELDKKLEALAAARHVSKHALLVQAAEDIVARSGRREDLLGAIDFVRTHDADLLQRLEDA